MASKALKREKRAGRGKMDITFLSFVILLLTIGLVMLFSSSYVYSLEYYDNSYHFISRQAVFGLAGVVIMLVVSRIDYHFWRKFAWIFFGIISLILFILLLIPPMVQNMGVKRYEKKSICDCLLHCFCFAALHSNCIWGVLL